MSRNIFETLRLKHPWDHYDLGFYFLAYQYRRSSTRSRFYNTPRSMSVLTYDFGPVVYGYRHAAELFVKSTIALLMHREIGNSILNELERKRILVSCTEPSHSFEKLYKVASEQIAKNASFFPKKREIATSELKLACDYFTGLDARSISFRYPLSDICPISTVEKVETLAPNEDGYRPFFEVTTISSGGGQEPRVFHDSESDSYWHKFREDEIRSVMRESAQAASRCRRIAHSQLQYNLYS